MAESLNIPIGDTQNIDYLIVTLVEKLDALRRDSSCAPLSVVGNQKAPMQVEIRTLEFWRSIISECLASFFYVFIICGAAAAGGGASASFFSILLATSLAAGFGMATMTQCFGHISGAHVNPAVTIAMGVTRKISPLRATMYITAQCGGAIAGAAFLYGVTVPGNLSAAVTNHTGSTAWKRFGLEFILTFVVVFSYFVSMDTYKKWMGNSALAIGAAYTACTFVSMPYLNPARSLGPSFVLNKWDNHWVHWFGPIVGGAVSGIIYEFIFNPRRHTQKPKDSIDGDSSSIQSDEDTYDDLDKPTGPKFHGSSYNTYRPAGVPAGTSGRPGYCPSLTTASLYSAPPSKLERVESLYGGTKSLYCKSPPLTRANLNRSQSVYTKSNSGVNRDLLPRPGPLVPAQSLYPMRLNQQQTHVQNQNVQNQMQQRSESIYGIRGAAPGIATRTTDQSSSGFGCGANSAVYNARNNSQENGTKYEESEKYSRGNRPESMYGVIVNQRRGQSIQSDDSSYGSYRGANTAPRNPNGGTASCNYMSSNSATNYTQKSGSGAAQPGYSGRNANVSEVRQSPPSQILSTAPNSTSFHSSRPQHSPNPQY